MKIRDRLENELIEAEILLRETLDEDSSYFTTENDPVQITDDLFVDGEMLHSTRRGGPIAAFCRGCQTVHQLMSQCLSCVKILNTNLGDAAKIGPKSIEGITPPSKALDDDDIITIEESPPPKKRKTSNITPPSQTNSPARGRLIQPTLQFFLKRNSGK